MELYGLRIETYDYSHTYYNISLMQLTDQYNAESEQAKMEGPDSCMNSITLYKITGNGSFNSGRGTSVDGGVTIIEEYIKE